MNLLSFVYYRIPVILLTGILFSCVNDLDAIQRVTYDPKAPDQVTENLELIYTDSGYVRVKVRAEYAEAYYKPKQVTKLRRGLKVDFYNETGIVVSTLTAQYGEVDHATGKMLVRDSVNLKNLAKEQLLETEELWWNQNDSTIYTDKNVYVTSPTESGYGQGIRTTQSFDTYKILNPVATIGADRDKK